MTKNITNFNKFIQKIIATFLMLAITLSATSAALAAGTPQTITFTSIMSPMTYGDVDFIVTATSDSMLPVTFSATGACTVAVNIITITSAGSCTINADQAGDITYDAAPTVTQILTINKKDIAISASDFLKTTKVYDVM